MLRNLVPLEIRLILLIAIRIIGEGELPDIRSAIGQLMSAFSQHSLSEPDEKTPNVRTQRLSRSKPWLDNSSRVFCVFRLSVMRV